jgi:uncharacterized protein (TIGR02145 family)
MQQAYPMFVNKIFHMRLIVLNLLLFICIQGFTQSISVKSFRLLENDVDARQNFPERDQNGNLCAIIKIVTSETGFDFDNGTLGITKVVPKTAEIWLYVPYGTRRLSIAHPKLGMIRDFIINIPIQEGRSYELLLMTEKITPNVEESITAQWLNIIAQPKNAIIYVNDGEFEALGEFTKKLKPGKYTYRVEAPLYHNTGGTIELTLEKKAIINISLKPNFGYAQIITEPETGAKITIDGTEDTCNSPCKSNKLKIGVHYLTASKPMFKTQRQTFIIIENQTTTVTVNLQPNFAILNVNTDKNAVVTVNNKQKSIGNWNGRLDPGVYCIEAQLENYKTAKQDIELVAGDNLNITLNPTPLYGKLDIISFPGGAAIVLEPYKVKISDVTPYSIDKLLIGQYKLILSKTGYGTISKSINILEGKTTEFYDTLPNGKLVNITSSPSGVILFVDDINLGKTPYKGILSFGKHVIKLLNGKKEITKTILISQDGKDSYYIYAAEYLIDADGNKYKTIMIGSQEWMAENLRTTKFNDGKPIPLVTDQNRWKMITSPAYCWYENNVANKAKYGALYNEYTVTNEKICPLGWHIPSFEDLGFIYDYFSGHDKSVHKVEQSTNQSNSYSRADSCFIFIGLPAGNRDEYVTEITGKHTYFGGLGRNSFWWTTNKITPIEWSERSGFTSSNSYLSDDLGYSIRCVKD